MTTDGDRDGLELDAERELLHVALGGPAASALADRGSIAQDLAFARDAALRYATLTARPDLDDPLVANALWNAAAIAYRRAFGSGKAMLQQRKSRLRLTRDDVANMEGLSRDQRDAHLLTLDLANKHVAHRVGDQEDARVVALLAPPPAPHAVEGLAVLYFRMVGPEPEVAQRLAEVAQLLLDDVLQQIEERRQGLLENLVADPDVARFYDQPTACTDSQ